MEVDLTVGSKLPFPHAIIKKTLILLLPLCLVITAAGCGTPERKVVLFVASSMVQPIDEFTRHFEKLHPDIAVIREAGGSQLHCRKISELNKPCDVLIIAEPRFFGTILGPEYIDWHVDFAENEMGIIYTDRSRYNGEITSDNWPEILLKPEVVIGRVDENVGPVGFRTLHTWKLAAGHYGYTDLYERLLEKCPPENTRPDATAVLPPLENGTFDYAFDYLSVARQHRLQYVALPPEINLGDRSKADIYSQVSVSIRGNNRKQLPLKGVPILFGLSIPRDAPNQEEAALYIRELFSSEGMKILEKNYQPTLELLKVTGSENVPKNIQEILNTQ